MQGVHRGSSIYYPFYGNVFSYNEIYNCGYESTITGARIPGGAMTTDFGCFYLSGPQDGDGTNPANGFKSSITRSMTSAPPPILSISRWLRPRWSLMATMRFLIITMAIIPTASSRNYNLFYNRSAAAVGAAVYPSRITAAHRKFEIDHRRITSSPACFRQVTKSYEDYVPRIDITPNYLIPEPTSNYTYAAGDCSSTCYVMHNNNVYSSTFSNARTTGNNTPPTCTGGSCQDGGVSWTIR